MAWKKFMVYSEMKVGEVEKFVGDGVTAQQNWGEYTLLRGNVCLFLKIIKFNSAIKQNVVRKMRYIPQTTYHTGEFPMPELKADCLRCPNPTIGATLQVKKVHRYVIRKIGKTYAEEQDIMIRAWEREQVKGSTRPKRKVLDVDIEYRYEAFCVCVHCKKTMIFILKPRENSESVPEPEKIEQHAGSIHDYLDVVEHVGLKHAPTQLPPEHLPEIIHNAFSEGATCLAVDCFNAACGEFRRCLDLATKNKLKELSKTDNPESEVVDFLQKNKKPSLHDKLEFLFDKKFYPEHLRTVADCVKRDGNDGLHDGGLGKVDAKDSLDSIFRVLEHLYTMPAKDELATKRIAARHSKTAK